MNHAGGLRPAPVAESDIELARKLSLTDTGFTDLLYGRRGQGAGHSVSARDHGMATSACS
ncbi:hypothetical protein [Streptomyces sp. Qhu_M48]|uniref:hypothetical protein n=1 Tax=Streptomyces sp. Qhu_M48 TaxID=3435889 RepID=UPI003F4FADA3